MINTLAIAAALAAAPAQPAEIYGPPDDSAVEIVETPPRVDPDQKRRDNWNRVLPAEIAWQVLHVVDTFQTWDCVHNTPGCYETNGLLGRHPSKAKIVGFMAGMGVVHYLIGRDVSEVSPAAGFVFEAITIGAKARTVKSNWKLVF